MKRNRPRHHQRKPTPRRVHRKQRDITRMPSIRTETARTTLTWKTEISIMCIMFTIALLVGFALMAQYYEYYNRPKANDKHELYMSAFAVWQLFDICICRYGQYEQYEVPLGGGGDALWILIFPMAVLSTMMIMGILSFMKFITTWHYGTYSYFRCDHGTNDDKEEAEYYKNIFADNFNI